MPLRFMECGPKCRSRKHAYELNASVSKGNLLEIQRYTSLCYNGAQLSDFHGRTALHMAASCGKTDVVEWLMESMHGDVTKKDQESGWTALHRAVFYGQLAAARLLIQYKSDLYTRDHEGLGPLDIAMKDRALVKDVPPAVFETTDSHEVFTWGDNLNFTLGQSIEQGKKAPEVVDEFRKRHIGVKQIVMCKYHTVFLTNDGCVFTCGHGQGGRLGHPSEQTCLVPKQIEGLKSEECIEIAAARDHTLVLCQSGTVYSCGMNTCHQLGQLPIPDKCLVPKPVNCKTIKGQNVKGVCAGRFHSVLYTSTAVFTCGFNAGQLGQPKPKGDRRIGQLKQVSRLNMQGLTIVSVKCSDAATVVLTADGEIHVLHEYQCRKIASNRPDIQRLCVVGGNLDHTDSQIIRENGGRELIISYLNTSGKVFIWHENSPSLKRAHWMIRRQLHVVDFILYENGIAIVTDHGEAFQCTFSNKPLPVRETSNTVKESVEGEFGQMSLMELLMQEEIEELQVKKVPNVHRAMYITADPKGRNLATLQSLPNCSLTDVPVISVPEMTECFSKLLDEADEYDLIHDLILQAIISAHTMDQVYWSGLPGLPKKLKWPVKIVQWLDSENVIVYSNSDNAYIKDYMKRTTGISQLDSAMRANMSPLEVKLLETQDVMEVRGKYGRGVPVVVPQDIREVLSYLVNADVREQVGVLSTNKYLFPNRSIGVIRAYDSLKIMCQEVILQKPEKLTSVNLRKYTATISQVFDLNSQQQQWLANHLGHSMDIHRIHYRQTSGLIERIDMAKLMLMQEYNITAKYAGRKLQDIQLPELVFGGESADTVQMIDENLDGVSLDQIEDDDEGFQPNLLKDDNFDEYNFDDDDVPQKTTRKKGDTSTRVKWNNEEIAEVRLLFKENLDSRQTPGRKQIEVAKTASKASNGAIHKRHWETIKKKVWNLIQKDYIHDK